MIYYLMAVGSALCFASQFGAMKLYQKNTDDTPATSLVFSILSGLLSLPISWALNGFALTARPMTVFLGALFGLTVVLMNVTSLKIMAYGSLSVYSQWMMLGGMMLPYLFGIAVFRESVTAYKIVGMIVLTASLLLTCRDGGSEGGRSRRMRTAFILLCAAVFVLNGAESILGAVQGNAAVKWQVETSSEFEFAFWQWVFTVVFSLPALPFALGRGQGRQAELAHVRKIFHPAPLLAGALYTVISLSGNLLLWYCTPYVDSSVLFPITTGGTVAFSGLIGWLIYKEKPTRLSAVCLAMTVAATVLFVVGEGA